MKTTLRTTLGSVTLACGLLAAGGAPAAIITFDMAATFAGDPSFSGSGCSVGGCQLSGSVVIDNVLGIVKSANIGATGFSSPLIGPFTVSSAPRNLGGVTNLQFNDAPVESFMSMFFSTPTAGSLVGYTGGAISTRTLIRNQPNTEGWLLTSGSLTATSVTSVPEPASLALALSALGCLAGLTVRRSHAPVAR